jgi:hypothetical protein
LSAKEKKVPSGEKGGGARTPAVIGGGDVHRLVAPIDVDAPEAVLKIPRIASVDLLPIDGEASISRVLEHDLRGGSGHSGRPHRCWQLGVEGLLGQWPAGQEDQGRTVEDIVSLPRWINTVSIQRGNETMSSTVGLQR